ncbi:DUF2569 family protein [Aminobacter sp. MET-1]|uniref:DUF2569 family protein n=1 Tax=Aminobacter sp. MET-1 TaxID=2951085 RepID=UPI00226A2DFE|nr:DUF2569 family protein [Aminobacter sp. MET-1]MCX8569720.1 DUF2569 domain-containing protein [Aminobacter sp. MET-1]
MTIQPPITEDEPKGLGGWLILPMVGLLAAPLLGLGHFGLLLSFGKVRLPELQLDLLRTSFFPYVFFYVASSILGPIGLLVLMFRKKRSFPSMYWRWAVLNIALVVMDLALAVAFFGGLFRGRTSLLDYVLTALWRAGGLYGIGIIYMRRSLRVRNTFIN